MINDASWWVSDALAYRCSHHSQGFGAEKIHQVAFPYQRSWRVARSVHPYQSETQQVTGRTGNYLQLSVSSRWKTWRYASDWRGLMRSFKTLKENTWKLHYSPRSGDGWNKYIPRGINQIISQPALAEFQPPIRQGAIPPMLMRAWVKQGPRFDAAGKW